MKKKQFTLYQFSPPPTLELFDLRNKIWQGIFQLYQIDIFEREVINIIHQYSKSYSKFPVDEIIRHDAVEVLDFFANQLNPKDYSDYLIVQKYLDFLESHKVEFNNELRKRFFNETYEVSRILSDNWNEIKNCYLDGKDYEQFKQNQIKEYFANYDFKDYQDFFAKCHEIKAVTKHKNHYYSEFPSRRIAEFIFLACENSKLYLDVLKYYLNLGDPFQLNYFLFTLIEKSIEIYGVEKALELLNQFDFASKRKWLFGFYNLLPEDKITSDYLKKLYNLYWQSELDEIPQRFDFLLKYSHLDKNVVAQVTEIILSKINQQTNYPDPFDFLFNRYTQVNELLIELFTEKLDVLKQAYLLSQKINGYSSDYEDIFIRILAADQNFIIEYIDWVYDEQRKLSNSPYFEDDLNYTFLWQYENYQELITTVVEHIYQREKELSGSGFRNTILERIFILEVIEEEKVVLEDRQNKLLKSMIENRYEDIDWMQLLFSVTTTFPYKRRYQFIDLFCKYNQNFEDFKKLPLEPYFENYKNLSAESFILSSSKSIEATHKIVEYLKSLLRIFNTVELLKHKQYVEQKIQDFQKWIEDEKKEDFIRD